MTRVTIKDIAKKTQMSQGTVHRALNGKKGVSDKVRDEILQVATDLGYKPNYVASSLKRKPLNIVVSLPRPINTNKYYYKRLWQGIEKAKLLYKDYNINFIEVPYDDDKNVILESVIHSFNEDIDGLLSQANLGFENEIVLKKLISEGIPTSLVVDDLDYLDSVERLCFVGPNYDVSGRLLVELLSTQIKDGMDILVFCGNKDTPSHKHTVIGMEQYILENNLDYNLIKLFDNKGVENALDLATKEILNNKNLGAIFSVNAKNTVRLCNLLETISYNKNIRVIGSDVFTESIEFMEKGLLNNILHKSPENQSYMALKMLIDYIIKKEVPANKVNFSNTQIVFKSNLQYYKTN